MTNPRKRACGLVRVSSDEQARGGYGLQFQEQDIRTFCERNDLELLRVFRDEGYSGATSERPGFQEMITWARERRFDVLVVWKLDRLFRDTKLTLQTVDDLASLDIECRSVQETFTHDSNGRFLLTIFAAGAEKERRDIALRMYSGRIASARRGTYINGGGTPPYGYRFNRVTKRLDVDKFEARVIRKIFRWLVDEKLSLYKIQDRLNERRIPTKWDRIGRRKPTGSTAWWRTRTIGRILANEVYTGTFTFRKYRNLSGVRDERNLRPSEEWISITTPAIVSKEIFQKAQQQLRRNSVTSLRRTTTLYPLGKLLVCGHDGRTMGATTNRSKHAAYKYYYCLARGKHNSPQRCPSASIPELRVVSPVWTRLVELLTRPEQMIPQLLQYKDNRSDAATRAARKKALEAQKESLTRRKERLVQLYLGGAIDNSFFEKERRGITNELALVHQELAILESVKTGEQRADEAIERIKALYGLLSRKLSSASDEVKYEILHLFLNRVVVNGEALEMHVNLPDPQVFAGQETHGLSRKETVSLTLTTDLSALGLRRH